MKKETKTQNEIMINIMRQDRDSIWTPRTIARKMLGENVTKERLANKEKNVNYQLASKFMSKGIVKRKKIDGGRYGYYLKKGK